MDTDPLPGQNSSNLTTSNRNMVQTQQQVAMSYRNSARNSQQHQPLG